MPGFFRLGLIGYPLGHSYSPALHAAAFRAAGVAGEYRLYPVAPLPAGQADFQQLFARLRQGELHGLNVTIPHKQSVIPMLDQLTPTARAVGAVNLIYRQHEQLYGDNSDVAGFAADLAACGWALAAAGGPGAARALVLGAGGSARAVAAALLAAGWQVGIAARRLEQAQALAVEFGSGERQAAPGRAEVAALGLTQAEVAGFAAGPLGLIVNTTPVGMAPLVEASPWPAGVAFPAAAWLYDLVYNPPETALLRAARAAGLPARGGLGMLVEQAALAWERWTGVPADRAAMWQAVANKEQYAEIG